MRTLLLLIFVTSAAFCAHAETRILRQSGDCKIVRAESNDAGVVKVPLKSEELDILCKFRVDDFMGHDAVMAGPLFKNLSGKELEVAFHVAFFGKTGELIGGGSQRSTLRADAKTLHSSTCIITVPPAEVAKIVSYKVTVYIEDAKPKK